MPLTRHLYKEDEVSAALLFCILNARHVEAAFWCLEMLDSEMLEELMNVLRRSWLYGIGVKNIGWLRAFRDTFKGDVIDPDEVIKLTIGLSRSVKDRSILTVLGANLQVQPDRVNKGVISDKYDSLEKFTGLAIHQRKTLCAWGGIRAMENPDAFLCKIALSKHGVAARKLLTILDTEILHEWERRAAAVAALCLSRDEFTLSWNQCGNPELLKEVTDALKEWQPLLGRRLRRIYKIPSGALYWMCERGRTVSVYDTNIKELIGRVEKSSALWGSKFWDTVAGELGGWSAIKTNDSIRETFYDTYFPDDIPDEWSVADQEKSHGAGPLQRGTTAEAGRALQSLFGRFPSSVLWCSLPPIKNVGSWEDLWSELGRIDIGSWCLVPATCRKILTSENIDFVPAATRVKTNVVDRTRL
jgi:hypothetical protein